LEVVLEVRKSIEVKIEQTFAISISDSAGKEEAREALFVSGMRAIRTEESKRRQLADF